jgi:hypothetical protein
MKEGKNNFPPGDDIEGGGKRNKKSEQESPKEDPFIKAEHTEAGYQSENENKSRDKDFRLNLFFQAYNKDEKKKEKYFYPGIQVLEKPFRGRSLPLDIPCTDDLCDVAHPLFKKGHFQAPFPSRERGGGRPL